MSDEERLQKGLRTRKEVLGAEYVDAVLGNADSFSREFQELVTEFCWGASWGGEALSRRDRSLLTLVILGTLGRAQEFKLHLGGALRNGCTPDEVREALIHLSIYAGIPAGVEAFRLARSVLEETAGSPDESGESSP